MESGLGFKTMEHIIIVGGGLVGSLNACFFAKRGYRVDMYEARQDIRDTKTPMGRSINLALSYRGLEALKHVGLDQMMRDNGIPMHARMIHDMDGTRRPIPYGQKHQYIMSVDRARLNKLMLTAAEQNRGVNIHFDHKCVSCDFDAGEVTFKKSDGSLATAQGDLIVGCDGAYSAVRKSMMKAVLLDYSQTYVQHGYMEMRIPPTEDNDFAMEINYLHIWPRNEFMMIALPNVEDKSFVVTLFMPFEIYNSLKTEQDLISFFEDKFPDAIPLIGRDNIVQTYFSLTPLALVSVKCKPYHVRNKAVLMGDAGHAMVPFYGQGMNCGFEDCLVFDDIMNQFNDDFGKALAEYTNYRGPDAHAIVDLAMANYKEMRASVNTQSFLWRKRLDNFLHAIMPRVWLPLYSSVAFTRTRYDKCIQNRKWQDEILKRLLVLSLICATVGGASASRHLWTPSTMDMIKDAFYSNPVVKQITSFMR